MESLKDALTKAGFAPLLAKITRSAAVLDAPIEEPEPACQRCRGAGFLRHDVQPGDPRFGQLADCSCEIGQDRIKRRQERIWAEAMIPPRMRDFTLETLAAKGGKWAELADDLRAWRETGRWLVLTGPKGTCKTGASVALLNERLAAGGHGMFVKPARFLQRIRQTYGNDSEIDESQVLQTLIDAPLLVLDDLGTEQLTPWSREKFFTVIDEREGRHLIGDERITVITTNLPLVAPPRIPGQTARQTLPAHLDDEGRTWDRIRGWADVIELSGASQRGLL